ncbi:MAG: KaiC domain protein [Halobacteriales archaeon]
MSEDDDWFERAIADADDADGETDGDSAAGTGEGGGEETADGAEENRSDAGGVEFPDDGVWETAEPFDGSGVDADGGAEEDGLFDDDFASALEEIDPSEATGGASGGARDGPDGGFGVNDAPEGEGLWADESDGADAFDGAGGFGPVEDDLGPGNEFGPGGLGVGGTGFGGPDEVDSDIDRIDLGIEGLDAMIQGGVPERSLMVAIGAPGTGKTTFGFQFLDEALSSDERAVFIALEERRESIVQSAVELGFPFDEYVEAGDLAVVDIDPIEMSNSLQNIRSELPGLVRDFGASRLALDSVSLLEMMYEDRARRRNEIYDFTRSLEDAGVTTLLLSEASEDNPYASRYGIVEYLTDAVFVLQYVRPSDFRETRLAVEIQKIRNANHSRETKPYDITDEGIDVHRDATIF